MSKEKRNEADKVGVIVEMRVKKSLKSEIASNVARGLKTTGFKLDESYEPVRMSPSREKDSVIADDEEGIIIRGFMKESKIKELSGVDLAALIGLGTVTISQEIRTLTRSMTEFFVS